LDRIDLVIMLTREESSEIFNENFRLIQVECQISIELTLYVEFR